MVRTKNTNAEVSMADMQPGEATEVVNLLTEAMSSNPINRAVFRSDSATSVLRQKKMFQYVTTSRHNTIRVAKIDGTIVGVMCYCASDHCQLTPFQMILKLPSLIWQMKGDTVRLLKWRMMWSRHDHQLPHVHLGPIAVHPLHQGRGIGSLMLEEVCRELDEALINGYLETDKPENLVLYERFGFAINKVDQLFGVTTWFMIRP